MQIADPNCRHFQIDLLLVIMISGATARLVARAAALSQRSVGRIAGQRWRSTLCTASATSVCHHRQQRRSYAARSFSSSVGDEEQERIWSRAVGNHQFVESESEAEEQRMLEQAELVAKLEQHGEYTVPLVVLKCPCNT